MNSALYPPELVALRDYQVVEKIAEGSMASVYKARNGRTGEWVTIKVPLPHVMDNAVLRERFSKEYCAGTALNHPNIVRTLELGHEGAFYYLVMELVEGVDLWERILTRGKLPEQEAVDILIQAARGVHEAHRHGIIHRDIKPDNILLSTDGQAKLADLGLIKELESDADLTRTHKGKGSPNFIVPEQFMEARSADVRCDVYSLGATLYFAVMGVMPYESETVAGILRKKLNDDLVPPRKLVPALSEEVDWTIRRVLQSDSSRRHATCQAFIQALLKEDRFDGDPNGLPADPRKRRVESRAGKERRRNVRYSCTLATICELRTSIHSGEEQALDHWPGKVVDLSVTGIRLMLDRDSSRRPTSISSWRVPTGRSSPVRRCKSFA